jgi:hypothetical protein
LEKSTFVFKSPEIEKTKTMQTQISIKISKTNSKNYACLQIYFIKICPEIALKYVLE